MSKFDQLNESSRRSESVNRIDGSRQQIAFQNDPKRPVDSLIGRQNRSEKAQKPPEAPQDFLKTTQKQPQDLPKSAQKQPETPLRRPKTPPGALLKGSWGHLGTIRSQDRKPGRSGSMVVRVWPSILAPQMDPKTSRTLRLNMHDFLIALEPVLDRS